MMVDREQIRQFASFNALAALAARIATIEEQAGKALDDLEDLTGLPLREAMKCVSDDQPMAHNRAGEEWPIEQTP